MGEALKREFAIGGREIGPDAPAFVIAEISANHAGRLATALDIVRAAADAGADAIKLQTYTPETMTLDSDAAPFVVAKGSPWAGRRLYDLYAEAQTPWGWHEAIVSLAGDLGLLGVHPRCVRPDRDRFWADRCGGAPCRGRHRGLS